MQYKNVIEVQTKIYDKCSFEMSEIINESEGEKYDACQFELNRLKIVCRSSKETPKKTGQFVTFWKRNAEGVTEPYSESDEVDFYVINSRCENLFDQFVFPKSILIDKGIISTIVKEVLGCVQHRIQYKINKQRELKNGN